MIMDGIDTLCQVALADQLNLSFDTYNPPLQTANTGGRSGLDAEDNLNTPVTTSSDMPTFFSADTDYEPLPITGRLNLHVFSFGFCDCQFQFRVLR